MTTLHAGPIGPGTALPAPPPSRRERLLRDTATDTAVAWAGRWFQTLSEDGRRVEGGWPGTLPEARAHIGTEAARVLSQSAMPALTREELSLLTRWTYDEARRVWRGGAPPARRGASAARTLQLGRP